MTRFREEHYATRAWKKAFTPRGTRKESALADDVGASRAQYFQKSPAVRKAVRKAQKAQGRLDGF